MSVDNGRCEWEMIIDLSADSHRNLYVYVAVWDGYIGCRYGRCPGIEGMFG